jgi:hypothetical protein
MAGPRWVRLDVDYFTNPKMARAGKDGRALHMASICHAGGQLTDGHITTELVPSLCALAGVRPAAVGRLVAIGLWVPVSDGYLIHDYLAMQDSRLKVETKRKQAAERLAKWKADHGK